MNKWVSVFAISGSMALAPQAFSQTRPSGSGVELTPVVQSAIRAATPQAGTFSAKIWNGLDVQASIPKKQFEDRYDEVQKELRHNAQAQLQRLSELLQQLNSINTLVICAYEVDNNADLTRLLADSSSANHWSDVTKTWKNISDDVSCVSGERLRGQPGGLEAVVKDAEVRAGLDDTFTKVQKAIAGIEEAVKSQNQQHLAASVLQLKSTVALFYVVSSIQVARLTKDLTTLANSRLGPTAKTPEADTVLQNLERLLQAPVVN
jgi:hypothetical protein